MAQQPTERVAYLAWQLAQAVGARVERDVRRLDLSSTQSLALILLNLAPGLTVADIARRTTMTPQSMGTAVNGLIADGLVETSSSEHDRRVRRLRLTADGARQAARAEEIISRVTNDMLAAVDPGQRDMAREIITRMLRTLNPDALDAADKPEF
jgi:DNA-binding MarR family transcriptional regulator